MIREIHFKSLYCSYCILAATYDTWSTCIDTLPELGNEYRNKVVSSDDDYFSINVLIGRIDSTMEYLLNHVMSDEQRSFEAYMGMSRNILEQLSNLNYLLKDNKGKNRLKYDEMLVNNTADVLRLLEPEHYVEISEEWKKDKWTKTSQQDRIDQLPDPTLRLLYGYISRVLHTINRDGHLRYWETQTFIRLYVMFTITTLYNDVFQNLPEDLSTQVQKDKHNTFNELIRSYWELRHVKPEFLIALTSFGESKGLVVGPNLAYLEGYKEDMLKGKEIQCLPMPVLSN